MSNNESAVTCNFCGNSNPIYYCNKCNVVFCSKCKREEMNNLVFCATCGVTIAKIQNNDLVSEQKYKCHRCKSNKFVIGQKRIKLCPGCNQSNISTIAEKKRNLIVTSRKLIYRFRDGYRELYTFLIKLNRVRTKLIDLRTSGFFHDPKIESIILNLIRSIPIMKNQIIFRIEQDYKILKVPLKKFLEPSTWTPDKFFLLEASISQIKEIIKNFRTFIDEIIENSNKFLILAARKMKAVSYYKKIYDEYEQLLEILPGELPICAFKKIKFRKCSFQDLKKGKGILFLTDRRMIFLRRKGLIFRKYIHLFDFFLEGFEKVELIGRIFKKLKFSLEEGNIKYSAPKKVMRAIINYFSISINFEKYRVEGEIPTEILEPVDLNLLDLKQKIELIITSLLSLKSSSYQISKPNQIGITSFGVQLNPFERNEYNERPNNDLERFLHKIQGEEFSLKNTLQNLEDKFNQGIISSEEYIRQFRHLQSELFSIRKRIEQIQRELNNSSFNETLRPFDNNLRIEENLSQINNNLRIEENSRRNNDKSDEKSKLGPVPLNIFDRY
ncbi:MAG: hypothetical protein HWN67_05020 [Candidatus Helarchaeota archaeon]|nr:hypothetical protein [Candidatus Helarchaeota archaeon]